VRSFITTLADEKREEAILNYCNTIHRSDLLVRTSSGGVCPITGRYTYLDHDLFEVEITSPFTGLKDGFFADFSTIHEALFIKDGRVTRRCRSEATATLLGMYRGCMMLERKREDFRKIVLGALEEGIAFDQLHFNFPRADESDEVLLTLMEDTRSLRQQRDEFILTRIFLQITSQYGVYLSLRNLAVLIERVVGVRLWCSDEIESEIAKRERPEQETNPK
jgi:hypothetical protein